MQTSNVGRAPQGAGGVALPETPASGDGIARAPGQDRYRPNKRRRIIQTPDWLDRPPSHTSALRGASRRRLPKKRSLSAWTNRHQDPWHRNVARNSDNADASPICTEQVDPQSQTAVGVERAAEESEETERNQEDVPSRSISSSGSNSSSSGSSSGDNGSSSSNSIACGMRVKRSRPGSPDSHRKVARYELELDVIATMPVCDVPSLVTAGHSPWVTTSNSIITNSRQGSGIPSLILLSATSGDTRVDQVPPDDSPSLHPPTLVGQGRSRPVRCPEPIRVASGRAGWEASGRHPEAPVDESPDPLWLREEPSSLSTEQGGDHPSPVRPGGAVSEALSSPHYPPWSPDAPPSH